MSARISPPIEILQGENQDGDSTPIKTTNEGELFVRSRNVDSADIYEKLTEIRDLLKALNEQEIVWILL